MNTAPDWRFACVAFGCNGSKYRTRKADAGDTADTAWICGPCWRSSGKGTRRMVAFYRRLAKKWRAKGNEENADRCERSSSSFWWRAVDEASQANVGIR